MEPAVGVEPKSLLPEIEMMLPKLANFHVFHWKMAEKLKMLPLSVGIDIWNMFFECASKINSTHWALMEFVVEDRPQQFLDDAAVLTKLVFPFKDKR